MSADISEGGLTARRGPSIEGVDLPPANRKRRVVVLLADVSMSMSWPGDDGAPRIDALNRQLARWVPQVRSEGAGPLADVEFAVITFGDGGVRLASRNGDVAPYEDGGAFVPAAELALGPFTAGGTTPLVQAVELAIGLAVDRQGYLKSTHNLMTGQPRLIMFSDGQPTDDRGDPVDNWRPLAGRLRQMHVERRMQFFAFGVPGVNTEIMRGLVPHPYGYHELASMDFKLLLDMVLIATTATNPYDTLKNIFRT